MLHPLVSTGTPMVDAKLETSATVPNRAPN